jgi:hypothetical protein
MFKQLNMEFLFAPAEVMSRDTLVPDTLAAFASPRFRVCSSLY